MLKTYSPKASDIPERWVVIDLENQVLGRAATLIADHLRGKNKPEFAPHVDCGDYVIVVNAEKVKLTGRKLDDKFYYSHSGYIGNLKQESARHLLARKPEEIIRKAVKGMLPKNDLGKHIYRKLKVYTGPEHPHDAQKPITVKVS
ncbi:MAG: 50S ribosomal protein L13 [Deltaproteobacteria bacterium]|nr:50S ribosomal protein L13 [Deltaproteobacteria bacterium]